MYAKFFGFTRKPFHITPDPEVLFLGPGHKEALEAIGRGVENRLGFVAIVGGVGLGKTTVLRYYLEGIDNRKLKPVVLFNPIVTFQELLKTIYRTLDREFPPGGEMSEWLDHLHHALLEEGRDGRNVVVIMDEAQNVPTETLEQLCLLSNLESPRGQLLQIVLAGQPELDRKLRSESLKRLMQRIALRAEILPLTADESLDYIQFRLSKVTNESEPVFTRAAIKRIVASCGGIPRIINIVCDNAFITSYGYGIRPVSRRIVDEVLRDLQWQIVRSPQRWWLPVGAAAGVVLVAASLLALPWGAIHTKAREIGSELSVQMDRLFPEPEMKSKVVRQADDSVPLPVLATPTPAPSPVLPYIEAQPNKNLESLPAIAEEKTLAKPPEEHVEVASDRTEALLPDRPEPPPPAKIEATLPARPDNPPAIPEETVARAPEPPLESKPAAKLESESPSRVEQPAVVPSASPQVDVDQDALLGAIDAIIQKRTKK